MRRFLLISSLTLLTVISFGQKIDSWTAFWNNDTTLIGFKDNYGVVRIEPKFMGFTGALKFDEIIGCMEIVDGRYESYYLTKSGKIIGKDSLYIFDNKTDCESEGYIRFRDSSTDKVGMFNRFGEISIPAEYNYLSSVRNGMITALKGAKKRTWPGGEHYSWKGGKVMLIDTTNKVLIDNFKFDENINFYSLEVVSEPISDPIRVNFKAHNGNFYSFQNYDLEFKLWLKSLLDDLTKNSLTNATFEEVTFWKELCGWSTESKYSFVEENFDFIKSKLLQLNSKDCDYNIFNEGLNPLIYVSEKYNNFFNNCGEPKEWIYPIKQIVINYMDKKELIQDQFSFLRTNQGYKLLTVTIRN
jgi:hypothetical protein